MPGPSTIVRRLRKFTLAVLLLLVGLVIVGVLYQQIGQALDRRAVAAPGRLVATQGPTMHLHCTGEGGPTVILEAGAFGFAQVWAWVQPRLAEHSRVCSYDRAGLGWSDEAEAHDGLAVARRLRALLAAAGEPGPYVLIGHSLGGAFVRAFVAEYPADVVAVGLVEPTHPDQLERLPPEARKAHARVADVLPIVAALSHVGIIRLTNPLGRLHAGLPDGDYRAACMFTSTARHLRTSHAEFAAWDATMAAARANTSLGERPLIVVSAAEPMTGMTGEVFALNRQMHAELAGLSARGRHVTIAGANHMSLITEPAHAEQLAELLRETIAAAREPPGPVQR
ncbi:alpha/beta hydrolase [Nannocystis sp. SCPEA4]|uniref:alpha/beta fold hydrolase n=1 Tax=Nannocystis sp. SCPEA4 TaxID=2996787 RepID=UPI00226D737E|nr:alpha/beta hydrolase [Nannocystis sp. SCPEA4]MCY1060313.1 alpha/beta hydrolase [Nannocystis sp. SCPEA4]